MDRRSFITRVLTGLAALPFLSWLATRVAARPEEPVYPIVGVFDDFTRAGEGPPPSDSWTRWDYSESESRSVAYWHHTAEPPFIFDHALTEQEIAEVYDHYYEKYGVILPTRKS